MCLRTILECALLGILDYATCITDSMVINSLDLTLARHIKSSSTSDPFVLKALATLDEGSPLFTCTSLFVTRSA